MEGKSRTAPRSYSEEKKTAFVTEIERRYRAGEGSIQTIAQQLGTCDASYYKWTKAGIKAASPTVKPYSANERERLLAEATRLRESGQSLAAVCDALGIGTETLRRWQQRENAGPELRAVEITALVPVAPATLAPPSRSPSSLTLLAPGGFSIGGLGVETAAALLRALA